MSVVETFAHGRSEVVNDDPDYHVIVRYYESCLARHGDTHRGVDWPDVRDAETRYRVMTEVIRRHDAPVTLLDFGCGAAHLYEWMLRQGLTGVTYSGLDLSLKFVELSRRKFPDQTFYQADLLTDPDGIPTFDYVVMNGVFTEKRQLTYPAMLEYLQQLVRAVFEKARIGIAFNVMSKHVEWERDDLFHVPHDTLASFLTRHVSRHFVMRNDYGLYEYTTYVYRSPG